MKDMKYRRIAALLLALLCLSLSACTYRSSLKVETDAGKTVTIRYESSGGMSRSPVFTESAHSVDMNFMGHVWYNAAVVEPEVAEKYRDSQVIARSSNLYCYESLEENGYEYAWVMPLENGEGSCILFSTNGSPDTVFSYETDFDFCIRYFVGGTETVPDMEMIR